MILTSVYVYTEIGLHQRWPGRVAQSVGHPTRTSGVLNSIPGLAAYFRFSFRFFKKGSCQLLAKGGLSLPRKSVVRLTDRPDMTLDVYRGRKTTNQQQLHQRWHEIVHKRNVTVIYVSLQTDRVTSCEFTALQERFTFISSLSLSRG